MLWDDLEVHNILGFSFVLLHFVWLLMPWVVAGGCSWWSSGDLVLITHSEELQNLYLLWYLVEFVLDFVRLFGGFSFSEEENH